MPKRISQLTEAGPYDGTEEAALVQDGRTVRGPLLPAGLADGDLVQWDAANGRFQPLDKSAFATVVMDRVDYGVDHTLTGSDLGKRVRATAALTLTLPADATENLALDKPVEVYAAGGAVTIAAEVGVTIRGGTSLDQFGTVSIVKDGADEFVVVGQAS